MNNFLVEKKAYEKGLNDRWSWLTKGILDEDLRLNTQIVLENSYKVMVGHKDVPQGWLNDTILSEDNNEEMINEAGLQTSAAVGDYVIPKIMFPVIRRVMPELIANKLVSVQPLSQPTGVIYYITYKYSDTKSNVTSGDEFSANPMQTSPAYSVYYSSEKLGPISQSITDGTSAITFSGDTVQSIYTFLGATDVANTATYKRIEIFDKTTHKALLAKKVASGTSAIVFNSDDGGTKLATFNISSTASTIVVEAAALKAIGADEATATAAHDITVYIVYDQEATTHIPEMEFDIDHMDVSTTERKLKVRWTKEAEQDMQAYHKIDVEQELVKVAAVQTNYEIDREVVNAIDDIVVSALTGEFDWTADSTNGTQGNYLDRHRALAQKMYLYCTKVAQYNKIAPADWAVVNPQIASVFQMLPDWKVGEISHNKSTFYNAGLLGSGAVQIYVDPNRTNNEMTMGYKATDSTYGAGIVYSPYANWMSGNVTDPTNFNTIRGTFSRYAITATPRAQWNYSRITIDNLEV